MNRDIKFRIWDKISSLYLCDEFSDDKLGYSLEALRFFYKIEDKSVKIDDKYLFQQFTELKDRNGADIYEGDIVKISEYNPVSEKCEESLGVICWRYCGFVTIHPQNLDRK